MPNSCLAPTEKALRPENRVCDQKIGFAIS